MRLARLLLPLLLVFASPAFAQTNCPGTTYLGYGQGWHTNPNGSNPVWTDLYVSFDNGASGQATMLGPFEEDADASHPTCNTTTWNGYAGAAREMYGTVAYNDGTINYSGAARFWIHFEPAATPYCNDTKSHQNNGTPVPRFMMVARLKIQSCTAGHTLTNRFIAVSCEGNYCEQGSNDPCDTSGYIHYNSINLTVSGF